MLRLFGILIARLVGGVCAILFGIVAVAIWKSDWSPSLPWQKADAEVVAISRPICTVISNRTTKDPAPSDAITLKGACDDVERQTAMYAGRTFESVWRGQSVTVAYTTTRGQRVEVQSSAASLGLSEASQVGDRVTLFFDPRVATNFRRSMPTTSENIRWALFLVAFMGIAGFFAIYFRGWYALTGGHARPRRHWSWLWN